MSNVKSKHALFALGIAVSVLSLWLAVRTASPADIGAAFARSRVPAVLPFLIVLFAFYWIKALRWRQLLAPVAPVTTAELFGIVMVGYGANTILPMQLGEVVRAWLAGQRLRLSGTAALASIALERLFDLLSLLALIAVALLAGLPLDANFRLAAFWTSVVCLGAALLLAIFMLRAVWLEQRFAQLGGSSAGRLAGWISAQIRNVAAGLHAARSGALLARITAVSFLQWALMAVCIWLSLWALGLALPVQAVFVVLACTIIAVTLPTGPGYVGSIQLAYVLALKPFGVNASDAIAASLFYHALAYLSVLLAGLYYAQRYGLRWSELKRL